MEIKEYSLSKEEKFLLDNQANMKSQYVYLATLIDRDMYVTIHGQVKKRLGLGNDVQITYDPNLSREKIFVQAIEQEKMEKIESTERPEK